MSHRTFDGVTIASKGRAGWRFGTERWKDGVFFRFEITGDELILERTDDGRSTVTSVRT